MKKILALLVVLATFFLTGAGCPNQNIARNEPPPGQNISFSGQQQVDRHSILRQGAAAFFDNLPTDENLVSAADLNNQLQRNTNAFQIIDVRDSAAFTEKHIRDAVNIPLDQLGNNFNRIDENRMVILICENGQKAGMASAALNIAGFRSKVLKEGMGSWLKSNMQTVTGRETR